MAARHRRRTRWLRSNPFGVPLGWIALGAVIGWILGANNERKRAAVMISRGQAASVPAPMFPGFPVVFPTIPSNLLS